MQTQRSTMNELKYDVIVIGTGPGGEGAAMNIAKAGRSVAVVERYHEVGGGCTHWGTIPSKALRHALSRMTEFNRNPLYRAIGAPVRLSYPTLLRTAEAVIVQQVGMRRDFYDRNQVPLYFGHARFLDSHRLAVQRPDNSPLLLQADAFIIASGSRPYRPANVDFSHPRVFDSDTILGMTATPRSIIIYGAGVIGCEYASIFRNLGCKVNLLDTRSQLLSFLDDEIAHALSYHLRDQGVVIRHNEAYAAVDYRPDEVVMRLQSGKQIGSDIILWANGRTGNSQDMGLEELGIIPNNRGQLPVNANYQTAQPHIYAVGDVIGYPSLASAAYDQGRFAAIHLLEGRCDYHLIDYIPTGIYTSPEISSVGRTEKELTDACVPYEVGHSWFKNLARAQITGQTVGMLKLLFRRDTLELLGIHCFGDQASEIVHIGQAIMFQPGEANSLLYFINTTFNYPTMAEAYRVAALNGLNRIR